jgi:hypothetical protein
MNFVDHCTSDNKKNWNLRHYLDLYNYCWILREDCIYDNFFFFYNSGLTAAQKQNNNSEGSSSNQNIRPKKTPTF